MRNDQLTAYRWTVAALLIILAIVCVIWVLQPGQTFEDTQNQFTEDLIDYRAQVGRECAFTATSTAADRLECDKVLNELADILADFRVEVTENEVASTSASTTLPVTTPTSTATSS